MKIAPTTSKTLQNVMMLKSKKGSSKKGKKVNTKVPVISKIPINTIPTPQPIPISSKPTTQPIKISEPSQRSTLFTEGFEGFVNDPNYNPVTHIDMTDYTNTTKSSSMTMPIIGVAVVLFLLMMRR